KDIEKKGSKYNLHIRIGLALFAISLVIFIIAYFINEDAVTLVFLPTLFIIYTLFFYSKKEDCIQEERSKKRYEEERAAKLKEIAEVVKPRYESLMSIHHKAIFNKLIQEADEAFQSDTLIAFKIKGVYYRNLSLSDCGVHYGRLELDYNNSHDKYAIKVVGENGTNYGFMQRRSMLLHSIIAMKGGSIPCTISIESNYDSFMGDAEVYKPDLITLE
ncbi:MAG: hypothetical protein ACRC9P_09420, partial [Bacteroides sp.]